MKPNDNLAVLPPPLPRKTWVDSVQALFEVLLLAGLMSSLLAALPFTLTAAGRASLLANVRVLCAYLLLEASITMVLLVLVMKAHRESFKGLGLAWTQWRSDVLLGLAIVPILFVLNSVINVLFQVFFPRFFLTRNPLTELISSREDLSLFIGTALLAGGIKEELQRAFILRRFQAYLGGAHLGLILWSAAFAIGHYVQGAQGMVVAGVYGLIFGIAYLARGSLTVPIIAHSAYDTCALLAYWFAKSHS